MKYLSTRRNESTSSATFEILIIICQIHFVNLFIFNCLTLSIKLFIFKLFDIKFLFSENHVFRNQKRTVFMDLWTRFLTFGKISISTQKVFYVNKNLHYLNIAKVFKYKSNITMLLHGCNPIIIVLNCEILCLKPRKVHFV